MKTVKIQHLFRTIACSALIAAAQPAYSGRVVVNHDEWTFENSKMELAKPDTAQFASNLASFMNIDGGTCNLLVYSSNFGLTGTTFNATLQAAGCTVTQSTGAFDLATLSAYDGVMLAGNQFSYDSSALTAYVNSGHSVYIEAGTAELNGQVNEGLAWDSFMHAFGLDFGETWNGIEGVTAISGTHELLQGVSRLYFNNGNTVGLYGANSHAQVIASHNGMGLLGVYDDVPEPDVRQVPEPGTLALLGLSAIGIAFARRRVE